MDQSLLSSIRNRIDQALQRSNRSSDDLCLIAVSKKQSIHSIENLLAENHFDFGENYVQEWQEKERVLTNCKINWHFIGHLQSNKYKYLAGKIKYLHSLDSLKLAKVINNYCLEKNLHQKCFLQIKLAEEDKKSGIKEKDLKKILEEMIELKNLSIKGLMIIPPPSDDIKNTRKYFKELKSIQQEVNQKNFYKDPLPYLSMGMSKDFEMAIEEGATHIRVGEALFGLRK